MELTPDTVIKVDGLHKKFCRNLRRSMYYGTVDVARDMIGWRYDRGLLRGDEYWALENVSFELKRGEAIGIIGQNGSGKTTLLRVINGIFPPDRGRVAVRGRIGALIAVGAGFHPHMTGRENIRLNGTILGMSRREIAAQFDPIVDFADIGDFLDAPVATYSSGMNIRLGFAIAVHAHPEILLADEVLAVGDLKFALKCLRRITEYKQAGGSLILVSHGMQLVRNSCTRAVWLHHGKVVQAGAVQTICDAYENSMMTRERPEDNGPANIINYDATVRIVTVAVGACGPGEPRFLVGDTFEIVVLIECTREVKQPILTVTIYTGENIAVVSNHSHLDGVLQEKLTKGRNEFSFRLERLSLKPGRYSVSITLSEGDLSTHIENHERAYSFSVEHGSAHQSYGLFNPFPAWAVTSKG